MLKVYTYGPCSTCRKATTWLRQRGIAFAEIPIRQTPPTLAELRAMLSACNGEIRRLFNTSGLDYKKMNLKDKLPTLTTDQALQLLAQNGNLIKRPFVIGPDVHLTGFRPDTWTKVLS